MGDDLMAALPHMALYPSDYLADTAHLSTLEHGAYLLLIMAYWTRGEALLDNDARLARIARISEPEWMTIRDTVGEFFTIENGLWVHNRIERELDRARSKVDQARIAGMASAERRSNVSSTGVERQSNGKATNQNQNHIQTSPNGEVTPNPFAGEAWDGWIAERKKKPTARAIALAIKKLHDLQTEGQNPEDVLNQSTMNGWAGLFAVKGGSNGKPSGWL